MTNPASDAPPNGRALRPSTSLTTMKQSTAESPSLLRAQTNSLLGVSITFLILVWITVPLRCYTRVYLLRAFAIDDWLIVLSSLLFSAFAVMCIVTSLCFIDSLDIYAAGAIPLTEFIPRMLTAGYLIVLSTMFAFKLSLGFYFIKILNIYRTFRILIWASTVVTALFSLLNFIWSAMLPCQIQMQFFDGLPACPATVTRLDWEIITLVWSMSNAITDIVYAVLSVLAVKRLQLPLRDKINGALLCGLGSIGGLASLIRFAQLLITWPGSSKLGEATMYSTWSIIEPGLGITAAAMATLRPLVKKLLQDVRSPGAVDEPFSVQVVVRKGHPVGILTELRLDEQRQYMKSGTNLVLDEQKHDLEKGDNWERPA